jgi:putative tricarboxylic transport membrane protein
MRGTWPVFACVLYVLLWNVVGFFVATPIYLVVMARLLGEERLWVAVGSAGAITAALWALFVKLFYLPLPVGIGIFRGLNLLIFYGKL